MFILISVASVLFIVCLYKTSLKSNSILKAVPALVPNNKFKPRKKPRPVDPYMPYHF